MREINPTLRLLKFDLEVVLEEAQELGMCSDVNELLVNRIRHQLEVALDCATRMYNKQAGILM